MIMMIVVVEVVVMDSPCILFLLATDLFVYLFLHILFDFFLYRTESSRRRPTSATSWRATCTPCATSWWAACGRTSRERKPRPSAAVSPPRKTGELFCHMKGGVLCVLMGRRTSPEDWCVVFTSREASV